MDKGHNLLPTFERLSLPSNLLLHLASIIEYRQIWNDHI